MFAYDFEGGTLELRGTSGAPVVDARGEVVGVHLGGGVPGTFGVAVPLHALRRRLAEAQAGRPARHRRVADVLRQLDGADSEKAFEALVDLLGDERPSELAVTPLSEILVAAWQNRASAIRDAQRDGADTCGSWVEDQRYVTRRYEGEILLDVLGQCRTERAREELRKAAHELTDPTLLYFAVRSMLDLGDPPDTIAIERVLASDAERFRMVEVLEERDMLRLAPAHWRTQEAIARSTLARWLLYPTEVGCVPKEIELAAVVPRGGRDAYVYRFRTPRFHGGRWLAGLAGVFPRGGEPSLDHADTTFSDFQPIERGKPAEHAARILALLEAQAKQRAESDEL
jgi:hypothetical protein